LQYEESPSKEPAPNQIKLCGTQQTCDPLVDWDNFINILGGNLSDFYHLFGAVEKEPSTDASRNGKQTSVSNRDKVDRSELNAQSTIGANKRSLSFLQGTGVQEHAAIETTLEQQNVAGSYQGNSIGNSFSTHSGNKNTNFSSGASRGMEEDEKIEIHPYQRKNDAPILDTSPKRMLPINPRDTFNQTHSAFFSSLQTSTKDTTPEEEIYDTSFTLNFLKVRCQLL
jgi:hypothetical protein